MEKIATMRDVFDFCNKYNLCSVAQGMIELPPPRKLREIVAEDSLKDSHEIHQYGARIGAKCYLEALTRFLKKHNDADVPVEAILATCGVSAAIVATLLALRAEGKTNVALYEPFYTYHKKQVEEATGKTPRTIASNPDYSPNWENFEKEIQQGLDAVIVCNPGNPSGRVWREHELRKLVQLAKTHNFVLIMDEIYCDMVWNPDVKFWSPLMDKQNPLSTNVVVCRGWSKSLAAQSWRVGFCVSAPSMIEKIMAHHDPVYIAVNWGQYSIARYLDEHYDDFVRHITTNGDIMKKNWDLLKQLLQQELGWTPIEPDGSMYGLFYHHSESDIAALKHGLDHGIGVAPGSMFFGGNITNSKVIRIHYGLGAETVQNIIKVVKEKRQERSNK